MYLSSRISIIHIFFIALLCCFRRDRAAVHISVSFSSKRALFC
jgi:hypothetical protein